MGCHGGFSLDEATRRSWYNPDAILKELQVGMVFVDVGCGDGFFSILAAKIVGEKGKVYAVDIDPLAIEKVKQKVKAEGLENITAKAGRAEETVFCNKCIDLVFFSMVLHDFDDPAKVLLNTKEMIKPDGLLVDLDWKKQEMPFGPPSRIRFSEERASDLIKNAGFQIANVKNVGNFHYLVSAKPLT